MVYKNKLMPMPMDEEGYIIHLNNHGLFEGFNELDLVE
jgi:hypothetical protein